MKIKYTGGSKWNRVTHNRKHYFFTKENNRTIETEDQALVDHISGMRNSQYQFVVEEDEKKKEERIAKEKAEAEEQKKIKKEEVEAEKAKKAEAKKLKAERKAKKKQKAEAKKKAKGGK